jgi:Na+/H+-dicarboxylate symporter
MDEYKGGREMKALKITGKILLIIVVIAVIILIAVLLFLAFYPGVGKHLTSRCREDLQKKQISSMMVNFIMKMISG